jgi:hypothetical protein
VIEGTAMLAASATVRARSFNRIDPPTRLRLAATY